MNSLSEVISIRKRSISYRISANSMASFTSTATLTSTTASITQGYNYQCSRDLSYLNAYKEAYREDVLNKLAINPKYQGDRSKAVSLAWEYEKKAAEYGGKCSEPWITEKKDELLRRGTIAGAEGHHTQNVANHPAEQANPDNIKFYRNHKEHLEKGHNGSFRNETDGPMIDRTELVEKANKRRVLKNEIFGFGLTAIIAFVSSASISFIVSVAKDGTDPESVKNALKASGRNGLEGMGLAMVCYGVSRIIIKSATDSIKKIFEKKGYSPSDDLISSGIIAAVTIVVTAGYTYNKLRKAGVSRRDSLIQVAKQSAISIAIACASLYISESLGNVYALAFSLVISAGMITYAICQTVKEKELMARIVILRIESSYPDWAIQ